jgi:type II secretory pathway pseudopilin PulG
MRRGRRRRSESGYALLLVFLMAAVIGLSLYLEMPRVAFDSERQKEQLLIDRGEQYKRAIELFVIKNKRWPNKIEDLENTNNQRFLRRRYIDPMTGKDEWRPVHIQNGILVDSKVSGPPGQDNQSKDTTAGQYITELASIGQNTAGGAGSGVTGAALANRRRASDSMTPGVAGGIVGTVQEQPDPSNPNAQQPQQPGVPNGVPTGIPPGVPGAVVPGQLPAQYPPGVPGAVVPGQLPAQYPPGVPGAPGMTGPTTPGQIIQGRIYPGQPGYPGAAGAPGGSGAQSASGIAGSGSITAGASIGAQPTPAGVPPGYPGQPYPGQRYPGQQQPYPGSQYPPPPGSLGGPQTPQSGPTPGNNPAQNLINNALYGPRPGGAPSQTAMGNAMVGGSGIAGFASTADADSIKIYNDRQNYGEWEFIYDASKPKVLFNLLSSNVGTTGTPTTGPSTGSSFGSSGTGSTGSSFGGSGTGSFGGGSFGGAPAGGAASSPFGSTSPRGR